VSNKNPTPGEITIMAGGAIALIFSFFDFYKSDSVTVGNTTFGGASANVYSSGLFPVATLMVVFAVVAAVLVALTRFANVKLPASPMGFTWGQIYLVLGFVATLYALAYLLVDKGGFSFGIGFWLVLIGCVATLVGAILMQREGADRPSAPPPSPPPAA
jgi:hypothetical protein